MITRLDWEIIDTEGRYIQVDFPGLSVISLYVPRGSSSDAAQARKDAFMGPFMITSPRSKRNAGSSSFVPVEHLPSKHRFKKLA